MIKISIGDESNLLDLEVEVHGKTAELIAEMGCIIRAIYDAIAKQSEEMAEVYKRMMYDPEYMDMIFDLDTDIPVIKKESKAPKSKSQSLKSKRAKEEFYRAFLREFTEDDQ